VAFLIGVAVVIEVVDVDVAAVVAVAEVVAVVDPIKRGTDSKKENE
jgi:hypothetical protein